MAVRKLPFWEIMPVHGGLRGLLKQMAWRHQRHAAEHEELMHMHRRWEQFFREAAEKSRREEA